MTAGPRVVPGEDLPPLAHAEQGEPPLFGIRQAPNCPEPVWESWLACDTSGGATASLSLSVPIT